MKLSDLIRYQNTIENLSTQSVWSEVDNKFDRMAMDIVEGNEDLPIEDAVNKFQKAWHEISLALSTVDSSLSDVRDIIDAARQVADKEALLQSYKVSHLLNGDPDQAAAVHRMDQVNPLFRNEKDIEQYIARIQLHASWQYPGAVIRPLNGEFMPYLTPADPLYVLDVDPKLWEPTKQLFTPQYQRRLRYKIIKEEIDVLVGRRLPAGQLGFVLVNNFFNYRHFELIQRYMTELFDVLRPGGVVMFTYNNCDLPDACVNFEQNAACYTPASLLRPMLESLDYEIQAQYDNGVSWLEVKKPGTLSTLRGGQTIGVVKKHQNT